MDQRISITELSAHLAGHGEEMRRIAELEARMGARARDVPLQDREDAATLMQQQFTRLFIRPSGGSGKQAKLQFR